MRGLLGFAIVTAFSCVSACGGDDSAGETGTGGSGGSGGASGSGGSAGAGTGGGTGGAAGAAGSGGSTTCTLGTTWTQVDDVSSPEDSSGATAIAIDANDTIYVAGSVLEGTSTTAIQKVRKSTDGGTSWQDAGTFAPSFRGIATSTSNNLFVGGLAAGNPGGLSHSVMLRSTDGAATFDEVDNFFVDDTNPCWGWNVATGPDGAAYGSGWCFAAGGSRWIVRKSADPGTSWSTILDLPGGGSAVVVIAVSAANEVYVAGQHGGWHVHRQTAQGDWSASDDFSLAPTKPGLPTHVGAIGTRVYVLGVARDADDAPHWIVRRRDAAGTWSTLDDLPSPIPSALGGARGVHEGTDGTILVTHAVPDASDVPRAITRRSNDDGVTWQTVDDYQYASGKPTTGGAIASDKKGNVYAALEGTDAAGKGHWLVRKLACQ